MFIQDVIKNATAFVNFINKTPGMLYVIYGISLYAKLSIFNWQIL